MILWIVLPIIMGVAMLAYLYRWIHTGIRCFLPAWKKWKRRGVAFVVLLVLFGSGSSQCANLDAGTSAPDSVSASFGLGGIHLPEGRGEATRRCGGSGTISVGKNLPQRHRSHLAHRLRYRVRSL